MGDTLRGARVEDNPLVLPRRWQCVDRCPLGGRVGHKAELRRCELPSMRGCAYTIASAYVFPFTRTQPHAQVCHVQCAGALLLSVLSRRCASCTGVRSPCAGAHSCTGVRSSPPLPFQAAFARTGAGVCQVARDPWDDRVADPNAKLPLPEHARGDVSQVAPPRTERSRRLGLE